MQMGEMSGMPPGTFAGHVIPGTMLLLWGLVWLGELWHTRGERAAGPPLESSAVIVGLEPGTGCQPRTRSTTRHVAAVFTSGVTGLVTRWAGGTARSRRRAFPAAALGSVTASVGYM